MNLGKDFINYATKEKGISSSTLTGISNSLTPYIMEERPMHVTQVDVFSRLMMERIVFLGSGIDERVANVITAQLLYMSSVSAEPIKLYINSPGGSVYAGLGIYDTMQYLKPEIQTICTGLAASMGAVLLAAGAAGKRYALPHSRVMIHQPMGGIEFGTQASDMEITIKEINKLKTDLYQILSDHTDQSIEKITHDADRDYWMTAVGAKAYGLIDHVLTNKKK